MISSVSAAARARGISSRRWAGKEWLAVPAVVFLVAFLFVPALLLALTSFWTTSYYQTTADWNVAQYADLFSQSGVLRTLSRSIVTGLIAASAATVLAIPVAVYLRFRQGRGRVVALGIIVTALFSSYLVRIYAWRTLLGRDGAVNWLLQSLDITSGPTLALFYNRFAVVLTLVHIYLPFAVITLFSAFEAVEREVIDASRTLGSKSNQTARWVILPLTAPGLFAAFAFTFILSAGDYVTPQLVGGKSGAMIGQLISVEFLQTGDYSHGAALSMIFVASVLVTLSAVYGLGRLVGRLQR